jgi:tRNA dimethylallyltransferase
VAPLIEAARQGGPPLFITGGTGLYFKALLEGLSPVPDIPEDIRAHWRAEAACKGAAALHALLGARDPVMASRLSPTDPQRIVRALEVLDATDESLSQWQQCEGERILAVDEAERLYVELPRDALYRRCDTRLEAMVEAGALDEVRMLEGQHLDPSLPAMRALGVRPLLAHLRGLMNLEAALASAKTETRHYAKRQLTWARRNMIAWKRVFT